MKKLYHLFLTFALLSAAGCNDFLDPDDDNSYKGDELLTYIQRAEGVLLNAYASVPNANQISVMTDVATDNAVWNTSSGNAFRNIVSGEWSSTNNPFDKWSSAYTAIGYCNLFLDELVDRVEWSYSDAWLCEAFRERLTAEARGFRCAQGKEFARFFQGKAAETGNGSGGSDGADRGCRMVAAFFVGRIHEFPEESLGFGSGCVSCKEIFEGIGGIRNSKESGEDDGAEVAHEVRFCVVKVQVVGCKAIEEGSVFRRRPYIKAKNVPLAFACGKESGCPSDGFFPASCQSGCEVVGEGSSSSLSQIGASCDVCL